VDDVVGLILSQTLFDILFLIVALAALILGFIQGAIRRLLGIAVLVVAFLLAATLRDALGDFLAANWKQFPTGYSVMIGFYVLFLTAWLIFTIVIQGFYRRSVIAGSEALDEIVGAVLGLGWVIVAVGVLGLIADSFFATAPVADPDEIPLLRTAFQAWDVSQVARVYRETIFPAAVDAASFFLPDALENVFRR
jgi:uncharacterized membrane protein required for colicin V production